MTLKPGTRLGPYEVLGVLGAGGMGEVYRARDPKLNRTIAIKVLPETAVPDPERRARFEREAQSIAALTHPNIVTIHSVEEANGVLFLTMEYVEGKPLSDLIVKNGLPLTQILSLAAPLADAISAAHQKGITHRDLKLANVMVTPDGRVKVLDFGLAKLIETAPVEMGTTRLPTDVLTDEGRIVGTVAYMSPEQAEGKPIDHRSDLFSLGVILYQLATGERPFNGDTTVATITSILRDTPRPITELNHELPRELARIVRHCLVKDAERRYQTAKDLRNDLEELKHDLESGAITSAVPIPSPRPTRWWPAVLVTVGAAAVLAAIVAVLPWIPSSEPPTRPTISVSLTGNLGREEHPALSPDGKQVAYSWNGGTGDNYNIWVKLIGAGTALRLTNNPGVDLSPAWSPDGRFITFLRKFPHTDAIFIIPALGGTERKMGEAHGTPVNTRSSPAWQMERLAWSPDRKSLAFVDKPAEDAPGSIYVLAPDTGERRKLTSPPSASVGDGFPAFSPDGQRLAFARSSALQVKDIFVVALGADGTPKEEAHRLTFDDRQIYGLDWTPDGRAIVFSSSRAGGTGLWKILASGGSIEPVAATGQDAFSPSIARTGGWLAYVSQTIETNIWYLQTPSASAPFSSTNSSVPTKLIASRYASRTPQFSPDGTKIVFGSQRSGSYELWVCDRDGHNPVQLTFFGGPQAGSPRWSPDGQRLAFDSPKEGHSEIYVMNADGGPARRVTVGTADAARPSWSHDGRWIYFGSSRSGEWQVWKAPADGGPAVQVTKHGGREAVESPDGTFVYYAKIGVPGIWKVRAEGGEETPVLDQGWMGHWALTADGIVLLDARSTPPAIKKFNFTSGRFRQVITLPRPAIPPDGFPSSAIAVSPDGQSILFVQADQTESEIRLVENFR